MNVYAHLDFEAKKMSQIVLDQYFQSKCVMQSVTRNKKFDMKPLQMV